MAARSPKCDKTKTTVLYSKYIVLNIPDLFKLSVAEFIHFFDNGELPKHFD